MIGPPLDAAPRRERLRERSTSRSRRETRGLLGARRARPHEARRHPREHDAGRRRRRGRPRRRRCRSGRLAAAGLDVFERGAAAGDEPAARAAERGAAPAHRERVRSPRARAWRTSPSRTCCAGLAGRAAPAPRGAAARRSPAQDSLRCGSAAPQRARKSCGETTRAPRARARAARRRSAVTTATPPAARLAHALEQPVVGRAREGDPRPGRARSAASSPRGAGRRTPPRSPRQGRRSARTRASSCSRPSRVHQALRSRPRSTRDVERVEAVDEPDRGAPAAVSVGSIAIESVGRGARRPRGAARPPASGQARRAEPDGDERRDDAEGLADAPQEAHPPSHAARPCDRVLLRRGPILQAAA